MRIFPWLNRVKCELIVGGFAIMIQMILGCVAVSSLVYKRYRERPQRPFKIWVLDTIKLCFGASFGHVANVGIALFMIAGDDATKGDECALYFVNGLMDTTLGMTILYGILRLVSRAAVRDVT